MTLEGDADSPLLCKGCPVGRFTIYANALSRAPEAITARRVVRLHLDPGKSILQEGDVPGRVYILFSGWAYRYKRLPDGKRQVLSFYIPGDTITNRAFIPGPLAFGVRALTPVSLCGFEREEFLRFLTATPDMQHALAADIARHHAAMDDQMIDIACRPAEVRVLRFLSNLAERLASRSLCGPEGCVLPLPQAMVADTLGLTAVYVNRLLVGLREEGLVCLARSSIVIPDPEALKKACAARL